MDNAVRSNKSRAKSRKGNNTSYGGRDNSSINNRNDLNDGGLRTGKKCVYNDVIVRNGSSEDSRTKHNLDSITLSRDEIVSNLMVMGFPESGNIVCVQQRETCVVVRTLSRLN